VAFKSGVLVKMVQKLEVSGRSPQYANAAPTTGYGAGSYPSGVGMGTTMGRQGAGYGSNRGVPRDEYEDDRKGGGGSVFAGVSSRSGTGSGAAGLSSSRRSGYGSGSTTRRGSTSGRGSSYGAYGGSNATIGSGFSNPPALTSASGAPGTITGNSGQVTMRTTTTTEIDRGDPNQLTLAY
jgi:hypothetical protein